MRVNEELLKSWIDRFKAAWKEGDEGYSLTEHHEGHLRKIEQSEQLLRREHLPDLTKDEIRDLLIGLDALSFWGDRQRRVDEILATNEMGTIRDALSNLIVAGQEGITPEQFRRAVDSVGGFGVLAVSEMLAHRFPERYWPYSSRVTLPAFQALGLNVKDEQPRGEKADHHIYVALEAPMSQVREALQESGFPEADYMFTDLFLWFVKEQADSSLASPLQWLVEILSEGVRNEQVIQQTNPFLERIGEALQERVGDVTWDTDLRHRDSVTPQYLNRGYTTLPHSGLSLRVNLLPNKIWWGLHKWGSTEAMERLQAAFQEFDLVRSGEEATVDQGDFGGWQGGAYFAMGHSLSIDEILQFPDEDALVEHIAEDLAAWFRRVKPQDAQIQAYMEGEATPPVSPERNPIASLSSYLAARGFHFPHHLIATYYLSLQTKPFVILSGLSGTGKTKLAQLFAHWLAGEEHAALIPVHPDWTDNRGLLGFHHLLTGAYHTTDFLHLLLRAYADYANGERHPYFAILDEMNLARVEHYFADFLSAMESRRLDEDGRIRQDPFSLHHQPRCLLATGNQALAEGFYTGDRDHKTCVVSCAGCPFRDLVSEQHRRGAYAYEEARRDGFDPLHFVPPRLEVPLNVYITGTVNVDETTFTFSPKVLDRANVIELGEVDLEACWERTEHFGDLSWVFRTDDRIARGFTGDFAYPFATGLRREARQAPELAPYRERLVTLLELLEPYHLHFGYRVADEILTYLLNAHRLDDERFDLEAAFDHAILQKILPRLNGPRERFQEPLARLRMFCAQGREGVADLLQEDRHYRRWEHLQDAEARLQRSTRKLQRMQRDLETEGFTSFT